MSVAQLEAREVQFEQGGGGLWADAWLRLRRNPGAIVGFVIIGCIIIIAIFRFKVDMIMTLLACSAVGILLHFAGVLS